jgi:hypothetical protein
LGRGFSTIVVRQVWQRNVSESVRFSRDLLACMAMPQSGQWRIDGGSGEVTSAYSATSAAADLIQIKSAATAAAAQ